MSKKTLIVSAGLLFLGLLVIDSSPQQTSAQTVPSTPTLAGTLHTLESGAKPLEVIGPDNAKRLAEVGRFGYGQPQSVDWSPDGRWIAVGTNLGVRLYATSDLQAEPRFIATSGQVQRVTFSPDSALLVTYGRETQIWEVQSGVLKHSLGNSAVAFGPDGALLSSTLCGGYNTQFVPALRICITDGFPVRIYDSRTVQLKNVLGATDNFSLSSDGKLLATGGNAVRLWDITTLKIVRQFNGGFDKVAFSRDGQLLASIGSVDNPEDTIDIWNVKSGQLLKTFQTTTPFIQEVAFSPDAKQIISVVPDQQPRVWDIQTGAIKATLEGYADTILGLAVDPAGSLIATSDRTGRISLWDMQTKRFVSSLVSDTGPIGSLTFNGSGTLLASGGWNAIQLWDTKTRQLTRVWHVPDQYGFSVAFSSDAKWLAAGSYDRKIYVWDVATGSSHAVFQRSEGSSVARVASSPDGTLLACNDQTGTIRLWDMRTGQSKLLVPQMGPDMNPRPTDSMFHLPVAGLAFSPDGATLASTARDQTVRLWDVQTGQSKTVLQGDTFFDDIAFSPDGKLLASANIDGTLQIWDLQTNQTITTLRVFANNPMFMFTMTTPPAKAGGFLRSLVLQQRLLGLRMSVSTSTLSSDGSVQADVTRRSLRRFKFYVQNFCAQPWNLKLLKSDLIGGNDAQCWRIFSRRKARGANSSASSSRQSPLRNYLWMGNASFLVLMGKWSYLRRRMAQFAYGQSRENWLHADGHLRLTAR